MATGFKGFLQGFAEGAHEIVERQNKDDEWVHRMTLEKQIQLDMEAKQKATVEAADQAARSQAIAGPLHTTSPAADTSSPVSAATTPIDPQANPIVTSPQAPAQPAGTPPAPITSTNTGVSATPEGRSLAASPAATGAAPATDNSGKMSLADKNTGMNILYPDSNPNNPAAPAAAIAPTALAPSAPIGEVTPGERSLAADALLIKGIKRPTYDQLQNEALKTRAEDAAKQAKAAQEALKSTDEHLTSNYNRGLGPDDKPVPVPAPAKKYLEDNGVPVAPEEINPVYGLEPKERVAVTKANAAAKAKFDALAGSVVQKSDKLIHAAEAFKKINDGTVTGGSLNAINGVLTNFDSARQQMDSLNKVMTVADFGAGSGLRTQGEFMTVKAANANTKNEQTANVAIANRVIGDAKLLKEYTEFKQKYTTGNKHSENVDGYYQAYIAANPMFDPTKSDFSLNPHRQSFKEFFYSEAGATPANTKTPAANKPTSLLDAMKQQNQGL